MRSLVGAFVVLASVPGFAQDAGLAFLPNRGQWDTRVHYAVRHGPMVSWLTDTGLTTRWHEPRAPAGPGRDTGEPALASRGVVVAMELVGAAPIRAQATSPPLPGRYHFLLGDDPTRWATDVRGVGQVRSPEVYPGIELTLLQRDSLLSYDFTLAPGARPGAIALAFAGHDELRVDPDGSLVIVTELGELRHTAPRAFALTDSGEDAVACSFVLRDASTVGFTVSGRSVHDALVIDPGLLWSGFLGGSTTDYVETKNGMVVAQNGELLLVGYTNSFDFPRNTGRFYAGLSDGFVTRYFPNGMMRWSTFLGGSSFDMARGIAENANGELYVSGFTASGNFPIVGQAFQSNYGGASALGYGDCFVARLTDCGCFILWSTYLGGSDDESGRNVAVDASNRVYVTGWTNSPNFPIAGTPYQGTRASATEEGFVALLDPAIPGSGQLVASTYLGGLDFDYPAILRLDRNGLPVIAGVTASAGFPTTANAFELTYGGGGQDAFLTMLDPNLSALVYSSFYGGSGLDSLNAMALVPGGGIALAGWTDSVNLPTTANAWLSAPAGGASDGFVAVLDPTASSQLVYGTFVGGPDEEGINGMAFETSGMVTVVGAARSSFPTTPGCLEPIFQGGGGAPYGPFDGFVARFDPARPGAAALIYGTYLGGSLDWDWAYEVEIAPDGGAFVAGVTFSNDFPAVPPSARPGLDDTFVSRLSMLPTGVDAFGFASSCDPLYASVANQPVNGTVFEVLGVGAPPNTFGLLLLGVPVPGGQPALFATTAFVDLGASPVALPTFSNAQGLGTAMIPLPAGYTGAAGALQWAWLGAVPPCPRFVQSSNALLLDIQ